MKTPAHPAFTNPDAVARYADGPRRNVPGYGGLLSMVRILLAEHMPSDGRMLVVGAGGGLELEDFARAHAGWRFDGVDPSAPMLEMAAHRLGDLLPRVQLLEGYVQDAPPGPYDGAACLLTLHFVPLEQRLPTLSEIHRRLNPGAPLVVAHLSVDDGDDGGRDLWMSRHMAFLASSGADPRQAGAMQEKMEKELTMLTPTQDETLLREAGFKNVQLFYVGFTFRGWVASA